jgi:hypothetical protein
MGFVDKRPSRMQGQWFFQSRAGGQKFLVGSRESRFISRGLLLPESTSPKKFVGGGLTSAQNHWGSKIVESTQPLQGNPLPSELEQLSTKVCAP